MPARRVLSDEEVAYLRSHYPGVETIPQLARRFACGVGVVSRTLRELGIPTRQSGWQPKLSPEKRAAILATWATGATAASITRSTQVGGGTVRSVVEAAGLPWENRVRRGAASHAWKGGRYITATGYAYVHVDHDDPMRVMATSYGYVAEHRLAVARHLGRPLGRHETVHHINGDKLDNRLANLQLRSGRHGKGVAFRCADCGSSNVVATKLGDPTDSF